MSGHHSADEKLVSRNFRNKKGQTKSTSTRPVNNAAPQIPKPRTNSYNQYR